ncbi:MULTISPECIES: tRNA (adenosine(37)-N6)-threonylcarbamoyltransferase complex dimerization subunit type 1 TsaB [unclassified Roseitalea]|uniref:tRNA (adenosine(37)-N6)-threonylcarbamoyltransferase complex dimerization subunit type 1 TsaB n=1 Tax=unclassified Roseitalea TaxID=2639107 RepID=UPI00273ED44F|nr:MULTISPECIES: tRNA (adenosine(37)-N6)-threonylcarbamoyltransferase complex dimerization subunit type 1 TsaB [unclassified Roseitalea]
MPTLVIDTAARYCSACLFDPQADRVLASDEHDIGRGHAERLMAVIGAVMARADIDFAALDGIAVTIGPGSFTGIRVGVAAARGYALALDVPATGVTTLEALAMQAVAEIAPDAPFGTVIQGGRGQLFIQHFGPDGAARDEPAAIAETEAAGRIDAGTALLVGNGAGPAAASIAASGRAAPCAAIDRPVGTIEAVARAGMRFSHRPVPLYLREADAKPQSGFALPRATTEPVR